MFLATVKTVLIKANQFKNGNDTIHAKSNPLNSSTKDKGRLYFKWI